MKREQTQYVEEAERKIPIVEHTQVLVVGGGPAGCAAAIAAARAGADNVVLMERYGYLGGMSSGGNVILIPSLSYGKDIIIGGIMQELFERLSALPNAVCGPERADVGSHDPTLVARWQDYLNMVWRDTICYGGFVDPQLMKLVLLQMATEAGVKLYLHSWVCQVMRRGRTISGVIFESKQGRQGISADLVIDCSGDADVCALSGAQADLVDGGTHRVSSLGLVYRLGGADYQAFSAYRQNNREQWDRHNRKLYEICKYATTFFPGSRNDIVWADNWLLGYGSLNVRDISEAEIQVQKSILPIIHYLHEQQIPGLEHTWLYDVASQLGVRGSRRIMGDYVLTMKDVMEKSKFADTIAVFPAVDVVTTDCGVDDSSGIEPIRIPFRCLLVKGFDNLLVAGRSFSSDLEANNMANLIPHCAAMGQAAGAAAALAVRRGCTPRQLQITDLQAELRRQKVYLPQ